MYHARPRVINMVCKKSKSSWRRNGAKTVSGKVKATSGSRKRGGPGAEPKYLEATWAEDEARTRVGVEGVAWRLRGAVWSGGYGFSGFAVKLGGDADRRTSGAIAELASRRSKAVKGPGPSDAARKSWTKMPLRG
ncbi:hypothetical protein ACP70R_011207 [Stipagrostis hirtigluma subsp. patula]